jgi:hypothetical protein
MDKDPAGTLRRSADDPEIFAEFYEGHFERILAYLARRVCDPDLALELTAETFAQAYMSRRRFRGGSGSLDLPHRGAPARALLPPRALGSPSNRAPPNSAAPH